MSHLEKHTCVSFSHTDHVVMLLVWLVAAGCMSGSEGRQWGRSVRDGQGPTVVFDPLAYPNPRIPFPNDLATVLDQTSPTGRRLNIRTSAPTEFERSIRRQMNHLDGFGTFAAISVSFDTPIDLSTVTPSSVKLLNIDPHSERYGESIPLDVPTDDEGTLYPIEITPWAFPPHTLFGSARQVLFNPAYGDVGSPDFSQMYERETHTLLLRPVRPLSQQTEYVVLLTKDIRGLNGDPIRSPFPQVAHDSHMHSLLRALPVLEAHGVPAGRVGFAWTFTTQTITKDLEAIAQGIRGKGPMSYLKRTYPAEIVEIANMQTCLDRYFCRPGHGADNPCRDNPWILQAEFLDVFTRSLLAQVPELLRTFGILLMEVDLGQEPRMELPLDAIDYFVFGRFRSIDFQDEATEMFQMDYRSGHASTKESFVPFLIAVPKPTATHKPPFPVVIHSHGTPSFRWEAIATANTWARHGYASACLDAPRHSPLISVQDVLIILSSLVGSLEQGICERFPHPLCQQVLDAMVKAVMDGVGGPFVDLLACVLFGTCEGSGHDSLEAALEQLLSTGFFAQLFVEGRAVDLDGDGNTDHGALFTADLFKCRDRVRQTIVDHMQFLQVLRSLRQDAVPPAVHDPEHAPPEVMIPHLLAGDFNADGILDVGGRYTYSYGQDGMPTEPQGEQVYFRDGISYGGITNSILLAVEPDITTAAFSVPGGGLTDILMRSDLRAVMDRVFHEVFGPILVGEPVRERPETLSLYFIRRGKKDRVANIGPTESLMSSTLPVPVGEIVLPQGGRLDITNQENGSHVTVVPHVCEDDDRLNGLWGCFSKGIASDAGDRVSIAAYTSSGVLVDYLETRAPTQGLGLDRNSPDFRSFANLGQIALDPADPINYAPHWFLDPLDFSGRESPKAKNVMITVVPGDMFVPVNTQIALVRAGGLLGTVSNTCDGLPERLQDCGSRLSDVIEDCDCVNLYLKHHDVMTGFYPRFDIDGLSSECQSPHTLGVIDNRSRGAGFSYVRFPFTDVFISFGYQAPVNRGMHWFLAFSDSTQPLNWAMYSQEQMAEFFDTRAYATLPPGEFLEVDCQCPVRVETCRYLK